jgi:hypothetical protein
MIIKYIPAPVPKVDAETPLSLQGEMVDRPSPAPNAMRTSARAAAATAPAAIAGHDTAACASTIVAAGRKLASMIEISGGRNRDAIVLCVNSNPGLRFREIGGNGND